MLRGEREREEDSKLKFCSPIFSMAISHCQVKIPGIQGQDIEKGGEKERWTKRRTHTDGAAYFVQAYSQIQVNNISQVPF